MTAVNCSLPAVIDPNETCHVTEDGWANFNADSVPDGLVSLTIATLSAEYTNVTGGVNRAHPGVLSDAELATNGRYVLSCPDTSWEKNLQATVTRPRELTRFGAEWIQLYAVDKWEVLQGEHEPWERNIWNSTVPLWGARPGFANTSTDPSQEPADVLDVHMPLPWKGDFEFRYGTPALKNDCPEPGCVESNDTATATGKWIAVEFKKTLLRVGSPWASCGAAESYEGVGTILPLFLRHPNLEAPAYTEVASVVKAHTETPVYVVLQMYTPTSGNTYRNGTVKANALKWTVGNANATDDDGATYSTCWLSGDPCPDDLAFCSAENCNVQKWQALVAELRTNANVKVLGYVETLAAPSTPDSADVAANCLAYPYGWGNVDLNELFKLGCYEYTDGGYEQCVLACAELNATELRSAEQVRQSCQDGCSFAQCWPGTPWATTRGCSACSPVWRLDAIAPDLFSSEACPATPPQARTEADLLADATAAHDALAAVGGLDGVYFGSVDGTAVAPSVLAASKYWKDQALITVFATGAPLFHAAALSNETVHGGGAPDVWVTCTQNWTALGSWSPFAWYPEEAPTRWGALVADVPEGDIDAAAAALFDRGYGFVHLHSAADYSTPSVHLAEVLAAVARQKTGGRRLGRSLTSSSPTYRWGCDDALVACAPVCLQTTGLSTVKVPASECAGAPLDPCGCDCIYDAEWACDAGGAAACFAKDTRAGDDLREVADVVCEMRGTPKPSFDAGCYVMGTGRGEAPSAECRAQSEAAGAWRAACGDVAPELCRLRYEAGLQALALKTAVDIAVEPVVREQSTAPPTTPAPAPSSVPPADTESPSILTTTTVSPTVDPSDEVPEFKMVIWSFASSLTALAVVALLA
jgi:hypothetical protein